MARVHEYKDKVVSGLHRGLTGLIKAREASTSSRARASCGVDDHGQDGDTVYKGAHIVLATGSQSRQLPGLAIDGERVITSDQALPWTRSPPRSYPGRRRDRR